MKSFVINSNDLFNKNLNPFGRMSVSYARLIAAFMNAESFTPESGTEILKGFLSNGVGGQPRRYNEFMQGLTGTETKLKAVAYAQEKLGIKKLERAQGKVFIDFVMNIVEFRRNEIKTELENQKTKLKQISKLK